MPSVTVGAIEIAHEDLGSGDPIVFIPGTGTAASVLLAQTSDLADGYRCVVVENRDSGRSAYVDRSYSPREMSADVAGVADALALGPPHVVNYSLGGAVEQELAIGRPDLVRSLVLVSSWATTDEWFAAQMRCWQALRTANAADDEAFYRSLFPWVLSPRTYATPGLVDGLITLGLAQEPRQPPEGFLRQCDADIGHDAAARLPRVEAPALVLVGEDDICRPPRYARQLGDLLPHAEVIVIPDSAHAALFESPVPVTAAISEFLARH